VLAGYELLVIHMICGLEQFAQALDMCALQLLQPIVRAVQPAAIPLPDFTER